MSVTAAEIADLRRRFPRVFAGHLLARALRAIALVATLGGLIYLARHLDLLSLKFLAGIAKLGTILSAMWPPELSGNDSPAAIAAALGQTVGMAFLGTLIAALIAVPLGALGARAIVRNPVLHFLLRRSFDFFRGMPALIWALVFARAVGLGPMTGVLAFIAADFAALSKLNAEAIEAAEGGALEAVRATGASSLAALRFGLLPQVLPVTLSQALYFFESNVRSATILGIVGAGGIGGILDEAIRYNLWREVAQILIVLFITVALIDQASRLIRERLIGKTA
jgi:phosphonate transport system permease protein